MPDPAPRSWQLLMVGPGLGRITPDIRDKLAGLLDLLPAVRVIDVETDMGGVTVSRDWPSDRMDVVATIEAEVGTAPGIVRLTLFEDAW